MGAPVVCDTKADKVIFLSSYWYMAHFARFIHPGAHRVLCGTSRDALEVTAFVNLDGSLAVVVMNQSTVAIKFTLKVFGSGTLQVEAPERSITTLLLDDQG